ncbi:hypothetical protein ACFFGH_14255 [Lysobacter korlensis]|uniref:Porin domain-containing protein n=1 Tax=Lysobacter korlensis TaxID=553636 RepID=A0ABV6RPU7_9GAMM
MKTSLAVALAAALSFGTAAHAEVRVSGFGQIVAGTTLDSSERFPARTYTDTVDFEEESLFAIQIDADLNERVTATAQILAEGSEDFRPELAWAYANIQLGKGFSTKIGRQRIPFYRYSDFLDVGYAYPWIRPPVAMYNQPWSNADGISLSHNTYLGKWFSQAQFLYGRFEGDANIAENRFAGELSHLRGVSWDVEYDEWLSLRAAYLTAKVTITGSVLDQVTNGLRMFRQNALADRLDYNDDPGTFKSVGFRIDKANWLVVAEYSEIEVEDSVLENIDRTDWYTTVGRRFGTVMPHVTYGRQTAGADLSVLTGIPMRSPLFLPVAAAATSQQLDETFKSVGVRWDFASNVALKLDYTDVETEIAGNRDAELVSAGLVFTF